MEDQLTPMEEDFFWIMRIVTHPKNRRYHVFYMEKMIRRFFIKWENEHMKRQLEGSITWISEFEYNKLKNTPQWRDQS